MLSSSGKKVLLSIHILVVAIWIGTLLTILFLLLAKYSAFDVSHFTIIDKSVFILFDSIVMNISIAVAISGLLFSMFTNWGFFKFYWITVKWISIVVLALIIMFLSSQNINGMAALSDIFGKEVQSNPDYLNFERQNIIYTLIQLILLAFIVFISVIKPWGKRKQRFVINRKIVISLGIIFGIALIVGIAMQYTQLTRFRQLPINEINLDHVENGYYLGRVNYGFEYEVGIDIENHTIKNIDILINRNSFYAMQAEGIKYKIIREQKINLSAVTGATTTSKILMKAVETAITTDQKQYHRENHDR